MDSMKAIGIGEEFLGWVELLYSEVNPPRRRIKLNGAPSPDFEIGSGVAQGCPLSPLLFLFIAEPLTRLILQDKELEGIQIGEHTHKIAQFADDTAAYVRNWDQLPRLFELVGRWESATAMVANKDKTALIPMGSLKKKPPRQEMLDEIGLKGASTEPYEIYL